MLPSRPTVFLGGTCISEDWRTHLIPLLDINYFNPVVADWTDASKLEELKQRNSCDYILYVITPLISGVYSIAEAVDDSNKRPTQTIICVVAHASVEYDASLLMSLEAVKDLVLRNGATVLDSLEEVAKWLNARPYDTKLPPSQSW